MPLALFDLDNTLIGGDSDHAWGEYLVEQQWVDGETYSNKNDYFYQQYQQGKLDIFEYLDFSLQPLASIEKQKLLQLRHEFIQEKILPMCLPKAQTLLNEHKSNGDTIVIITSTNRFVTEPIAELLGVNYLLATNLEPANHDSKFLFTGKVIGKPCFREGKIDHLNTWLQHNDYSSEGCWFYSDSINDLPLLEKAKHPVAVDPDPTLRQHAEKNKWKILSLRD